MLYRIVTPDCVDMTFDYTGNGWTEALITAAAFAQFQGSTDLEVVTPDGRIVKRLHITSDPSISQE